MSSPTLINRDQSVKREVNCTESNSDSGTESNTSLKPIKSNFFSYGIQKFICDFIREENLEKDIRSYTSLDWLGFNGKLVAKLHAGPPGNLLTDPPATFDLKQSQQFSWVKIYDEITSNSKYYLGSESNGLGNIPPLKGMKNRVLASGDAGNRVVNRRER
jgi:hypothetical protein